MSNSSTPLLRKRLFTKEQFNAGTRLEKIYMAMLYPGQFYLSEQDFKYQDILKSAFHVMSNNLSRVEAIKNIQALPQLETRSKVSIAYVNQVLNDVQALYGSMIQRNKAWERELIKEKLLALAQKCSEDKQNPFALDQERRCYEAIIKLGDLSNHDDDQFDWSSLELPVPVFTDDIRALTGEIDEAVVVDSKD
ncbi:MAG: hypothetical protein ABI002_06170 [Saprospiraceae bacterium]